jgi:Ras-related protein Rab-8A
MSDKEKICKAILIGEAGVGKTCIIVRLVSKDYRPNVISTTGASYASYIMEFEEYDKKLNLQLWDTAGQENYRGLTKIFYKDAKIIILVYDVTNKRSFEEIKNYWYSQIKENSSEKNISKFISFFKLINIKYLDSLAINVIYLIKKKLLKKRQKHLQKKLVPFSI